MAGKKLEIFDITKLESMVEPLTVRVEKLKGNQRTPIPLPRVTTADGEVLAPGVGWDRTKILKLEEWIRQNIGGGTYTGVVADASGNRIEWSFAFNIRDNPEKPLPTFEDDTTFSDGMVIPQAVQVAPPAFQGSTMNWNQNRWNNNNSWQNGASWNNSPMPAPSPMPQHTPPAPWGPPVWTPPQSPVPPTPQWTWPSPSTNTPDANQVPDPPPRRSSVSSFGGFGGSGGSGGNSVNNEEAQKLREQLIEIKHQSKMDQLMTTFAQETKETRDEIRRLNERREESPDIAKIITEAFAKVVEIVKPASNPSSEIQRLEERMREERAQLEKDRERDRIEFERREKERDRLETERREREREKLEAERQREREKAEAQAQRERDRQDAEKREREIREEMRRLTENVTPRVDPILTMMQENSRIQQENNREMIRLQMDNMARSSQNNISPLDLLRVVKENSSGIDDLSKSLMGTFNSTLGLMQQAFQSAMQLGGSGESSTLTMMREGMHAVQELINKRTEVSGTVALAEAKAAAAKAKAYEEALKARQVELARQASMSQPLGTNVNPSGTPQPSGQTQASTQTQAQVQKPTNAPQSVNNQSTKTKSAEPPKIHGRTDQEWFGPTLPYIQQLRGVVDMYLTAVATDPPRLSEDGEIDGASPEQAMSFLMQGFQAFLAQVPGGQNLPAIVLFKQGMLPHLMDILLPGVPQEYKDTCVQTLMRFGEEEEETEEEETETEGESEGVESEEVVDEQTVEGEETEDPTIH